MNYERIEAIVREAGEIIKIRMIESLNVYNKGKFDFVTEADYEVEQFIVDAIRGFYPEDNVITEESENRIDFSGSTWVLDPIDGTSNFMHGMPQVAISLCHIVDGVKEYGIVHAPKLRETFIARRGKGAYLNGEPIKVSKQVDMGRALLAFGLPYDRSVAPIIFSKAQKIFKKCQGLRRGGSAALDICYVAAGRMDGYFEYTLKLWDYAAGHLILEESGGKASTWSGAPLAFEMDTNILVTNGKLHETLLEELK